MSTANFSALCFGKLPAFGDFVRYNASSPDMMAFDRWLQEGIFLAKNKLATAWEEIYPKAPFYHFLFYPENARQFFLGVLKPSSDKSLRKYPFLVSLQIETVRFDSRFRTFAPAIFNSFLEDVQNFITNNLNFTNMQEIAEYTESLSVPVPANYLTMIQPYREYLANTTGEQFWSGQLGSFHDERKYLIFKNLTEILLPLRNRDLSRVSLGFRFPMGNRPGGNNFEACFWQDMVLQLLGYPPGVLPLLFWSNTNDDSPAYLFLFLRPPSAKNFINLMNADLDSDTICKLEEEGQQGIAEAKNSLPAQYRSLLDMGHVSLDDFLQRLW
jgi:type VI secretion system ImpM family protein